jgi:hypothetical protein
MRKYQQENGPDVKGLKGWLRVYYGLDILLSILSKTQLKVESSVSGTKGC